MIRLVVCGAYMLFFVWLGEGQNNFQLFEQLGLITAWLACSITVFVTVDGIVKFERGTRK